MIKEWLSCALLAACLLVSSAQAGSGQPGTSGSKRLTIAPGDWPMYGFDVAQSRFNPSETAITAANVGSLKQKWFFATAAPVTATPAVVSGVTIGGQRHTVLYVGSWDHNFYALDADTGSLLWKVTVTTPQGDTEGAPFPGPFPGIQSSALVDRGIVYFGDSCGFLHAYPANGSGATPTTMTIRNRGCGSTGTERAGFPVDLGANLSVKDDAVHTDIFSSPVPFTPKTGENKGRRMIYVGAASHVDNPCIHGAEFALDAASGRLVWRFDTVPATAIGAGVWASSAIDAANDLVYIDTGDCVATASAGFAESIIALDASCSGVSLDGSCRNLPAVVYPSTSDPAPKLAKDNPVWAFAAHPNGEEEDLDFGSSPNIFMTAGFTTASGKLLVGAAGKDGSYYAVEGGRSGGALVWTTRVANQQISGVATVSIGNALGTPSGGFIGSTGAAYGKVFGTTVSGPEFLVGLDDGSGQLVWDGGDALSSFAPVGIANKIVFSGDTFGFLRAHDADQGLPLFAVPTGAPVTSGVVISHGTVFFGTGLSSDNINAGSQGVMAFAP